ncbi:GHKL domain-containing protein [Bacillus sp. BRMEA1]|uniref:histidine kinase N-terminal domain-containing protein n=1 Tax=Neobacillus endophyticus TaxID=2738405 RepID=UPI001565FC66|nr:histidine kinase N-terminal domain-containing protein [Neobacillus endophyticus]NRD80013.1 GHKL domain-containing protein [Neobacillus endophyticus]
METKVQTDHGWNKLGQFLQMNEQAFLDLWVEQIIVHSKNDNIELIRKNGSLMFELITNSIVNKLSENDLKTLAHKVAKERVEANINFGEFVYNINLGRSILIKSVTTSEITMEELRPIIDLINRQFDLFCYFSGSRYTELKDIKLQEKNLFISQTHKDRLAILGQMSSSFVHEFRNPLTSVMGFIKLLKNEYPKLPYLDIITKELEQLKFRITQFLHTSKMNTVNESKNEEITIKYILEEVIDFLYPSIVSSNIQVNSNIDANTRVTGDRNELKQVFLNLLMNAVDAVSEEDQVRKISICTKVDHDEITVMISNNGPAINSDEVKFIFEPFYTTKKLGTGIGLFVCKNIIEKHNGKINCSSNEDLTVFQITLPINKMDEKEV